VNFGIVGSLGIVMGGVVVVGLGVGLAVGGVVVVGLGVGLAVVPAVPAIFVIIAISALRASYS